MNILESLTGIRWKIAAFAGLAGIAVASILLLVAQIENRHLSKVNAQLDKRINDPVIGYVVQLDREKAKSATLAAAVESQNAALKKQAQDAGIKLAETTARLAEVQRENLTLREQAEHILSTKPKGDTLDARIRDIDARVLETLQ